MINELISNFVSIHPLLFHSIIVLASLAVVSKSADLLVYGISDYAKRLGVSDYLIGFLIVSIGTALPKLIASVTGAMLNQGAIVFGTILGSNIFKIPLLGVVVLIGRKIKTTASVGSAPIITFLMAILPLILIIDGFLSKVDGIILLGAFLVYIMRLWHGESQLGKIKKAIALKDVYKDAFIFLLASMALLLSARWLVFSSLQISADLHISPYIIGLVVIGVGASTPELTIQIRAIFRHHKDLAFGNVLGSIVANSTLVLGLAAFTRPFSIQLNILLTTAIFMIIGILYTLFIMGKDEVSWKDGIVLILIYIAFLVAEIVF